MKLSPIDQLKSEYREITLLASAQAVLGWDQETFMPKGAIQARSDQTALLARLGHERLTSRKFKHLIDALVDPSTGLPSPTITNSLDQRLIKAVYREWRAAVSVPSRFVEAFSQLTARAQHEWQHARKNADYATFEPYLKKIITMAHQRAELIGFKEKPYDTLLDLYEPGMTSGKLNPIFSKLKRITLSALKTAPLDPPHLPPGPYPVSQQKAISHDLLARIGFNLECGRLDESTHPFSTAFHPTDSRITTRYSEDDLLDSVSSTLHEAGHGLYEQGLPVHLYGTPLGCSISLGIHESQSRLWENLVGKSAAFWEGYFPILAHHFPEFRRWDWRNFYRAINRVSPSLIRVGADEVTYNLHILIRYEIEQLLFSNTISTQDLPTVWNEKYQSYLGITPPCNRLGVLQDVHWSIGAFGYFPTYSLGNLYASQLFEAAKSAIPTLDDQIRGLYFTELRQWLTTNIHQVGRTQSAAELVQSVTGNPLTTDAFADYVTQKFSTLSH